jgi:hypothetical protein
VLLTRELRPDAYVVRADFFTIDVYSAAQSQVGSEELEAGWTFW